MALSQLLFNIFFNLIGKRSRKEIFIIFTTFYILIRAHFKKKQRQKLVLSASDIKIKDQTLITFSGGGQLAFYFQGICAYLNDNFDLENVRFAGISAGSTAAASLATRLSTEASMIFGLKWFKLVKNRPLKLFFMSADKMCEVGSDICEQFGITDEWIRKYNDRTDYYFGVTNIGTFPPKHVLVNNFHSRYESFYAMSCSMRVLPFFTKPGYFRGMWLLDGGFSALFSIPTDANPQKIIRITPSTRIEADIQPNWNSSQYFEVIDAFRMPSLECIYKQFEWGYLDAMRCREKLSAKGLKMKASGYENKLKEHMDMLKKHGHRIYHEPMRQTKVKQDLSQFLPAMSPEPRSI